MKPSLNLLPIQMQKTAISFSQFFFSWSPGHQEALLGWAGLGGWLHLCCGRLSLGDSEVVSCLKIRVPGKRTPKLLIHIQDKGAESLFFWIGMCFELLFFGLEPTGSMQVFGNFTHIQEQRLSKSDDGWPKRPVFIDYKAPLKGWRFNKEREGCKISGFTCLTSLSLATTKTLLDLCRNGSSTQKEKDLGDVFAHFCQSLLSTLAAGAMSDSLIKKNIWASYPLVVQPSRLWWLLGHTNL